MKEILPFFILCIFFSNKLSSQDIIQKIYGIENGFNSMNVIESKTFVKDTFLFSRNCKEYDVHKSINSLGTWWEYSDNKEYIAFDNQKQYFRLSDQWFLDYDYGLSKGDTLKFNLDTIFGTHNYEESPSIFGFVVDSVYSEFLYGIERKIQMNNFYYFRNNGGRPIQRGRVKNIDGVGSIVYLNEDSDFGTYLPDRFAMELYCYFNFTECGDFYSLCSIKTITESYQLSNLCDSLLLTNLKVENQLSENVLKNTIATEFLEILDQNVFGKRYEIYTSNGNFVQRGVISDTNVNIGNLLPGLYFISFYNTEGKRRFERFYKSE